MKEPEKPEKPQWQDRRDEDAVRRIVRPLVHLHRDTEGEPLARGIARREPVTESDATAFHRWMGDD